VITRLLGWVLDRLLDSIAKDAKDVEIGPRFDHGAVS